MDLEQCLAALGKGLERRSSPELTAYFDQQAKGRVRSYNTASLTPFADRTVQEQVLVGHVHVQGGKAVRVEGFNGQQGMRWAEGAAARLRAEGLLAEGAVVRAETPLRGCPSAMR